MTQREIAGLIGLPTQAVCDMEFGRADPAPLEDWWAHEDGVVAGLRRLVDRVREGDRG
jgi:hypothetical protein